MIIDSVGNLKLSCIPVCSAVIGDCTRSSVLDSDLMCSLTKGNITIDCICMINDVSWNSTVILNLNIVNYQPCNQISLIRWPNSDNITYVHYLGLRQLKWNLKLRICSPCVCIDKIIIWGALLENYCRWIICTRLLS